MWNAAKETNETHSLAFQRAASRLSHRVRDGNAEHSRRFPCLGTTPYHVRARQSCSGRIPWPLLNSASLLQTVPLRRNTWTRSFIRRCCCAPAAASIAVWQFRSGAEPPRTCPGYLVLAPRWSRNVECSADFWRIAYNSLLRQLQGFSWVPGSTFVP